MQPRCWRCSQPDARVFRVPQDRDRLTGDLSDKMGTQEQRKAFFGEMLARRPLARTELLASVAAGDLVAAKLKFTNPDNSRRATGWRSIAFATG